MANPKTANEDDDVILYMDELTGNGLGALGYDEDKLDGPEASARSITSLEAGRLTPARLLETDNVNNPRPDHGPEIDDLEPDRPRSRGYYPGIDDGLLPDDDEKPSMVPPPSPRSRPADFPIYPGFPGMTPTPDVNVYQQKKTIAQGMMDLALISANANQFRYVLMNNGRHPFYYPSLTMIALSLVLQIVVGIGLIWNSRYNVKDDGEMCKANKANNLTVIAIFLVTILNVFISSFGVVETFDVPFNSTGS